MKIITVNLPRAVVQHMDSLCGDNDEALYPSRCELIRNAIREWLKQYVPAEAVNVPSPIQALPKAVKNEVAVPQSDGTMKVYHIVQK